MLATTTGWSTIKTNRNKLEETQRKSDSEEVRLRKKSVIKKKLEQTCDTLQKARRMQTEAWTLSDGGS
jgi:hypothetical protein